MKELKGWPFELLGDGVGPCGEGSGIPPTPTPG